MNATCNNVKSIEPVVILNLKWVLGECFNILTSPCLAILLCLHLAPCCPKCSLSVDRRTGGHSFAVCTTLLRSASYSYVSSWWLPPLLFVCLHLPTFAITLWNLISMRGNTRPSSALSELSGKVRSCSYKGLKAALPSKCTGFGLDWQLLSCTLYIHFFVIGYFIFFPSSTIHPSIHQ